MTQYTNVPTKPVMAPPNIIKGIKELESEGKISLTLFIIRKLEPTAIMELTSTINIGYLKLISFFDFSLKNKLGLNNRFFMFSSILFPLTINGKYYSTS
jgi:hypothetical protein